MVKKRGDNRKKLSSSRFQRISKFRNVFREHTIAAITAAFGFLIALSWRTPIQQFIDKIVTNFNLKGNEILIQVITAILVTLLAVISLIFLSKWDSKKEK